MYSFCCIMLLVDEFFQRTAATIPISATEPSCEHSGVEELGWW